MTYPSIIFLALLLWSFSWPKENLVYLVVGTAAFGSLAVVPPSWVVGADLLPNSVAGAVLILRYLADSKFRAGLLRNALSFDRLGLFTAFMAVAAISAMFFPRMFAGQIELAAIRQTVAHTSEPLQPTSANFTQLAYLCLTYGVTVCLYFSASDERFREKTFRAFVIGAFILIVSGLADFALGGSGTSALLAPFKTAQYAIMEGVEVLGARRIVGFMSEASAYGAPCVTYATVALFCAPMFASTPMRWTAAAAGVGGVVFAALSTSSTAFVGIGALGAIYGFNIVRRCFATFLHGTRQSSRFTMITELAILFGLMLIVAMSIVFSPDLYTTPAAFIDALIFRKSQGDSYIERMSWNRMALDGLVATHGLGVGIGGARTSNWGVAIISNSGILGACFMFGYILWSLLRPYRSGDPQKRETIATARAGVIVTVVMACLAGTTTDIGISTGVLLAIIGGTFSGSAVPAYALGQRRQAINQRLGGQREAAGATRRIFSATMAAAHGAAKFSSSRNQRTPVQSRHAPSLRLERWKTMHLKRRAPSPKTPDPTDPPLSS